MKYKVTSVLIYSNKTDKDEALSKLAEAFENAEIVNPLTEMIEASFYQFERCYHDQVPPRPCVLVQKWQKAP